MGWVYWDMEYNFDAADIEPMITYGTNPAMGIKISDTVPNNNETSLEKALQYMGFEKGQSLVGKQIDYVFLGSCTNSRMEDFRQFCDLVKGKQKDENVIVWVVPGSKQIELQAIAEGLDVILKEAGMELREPGCSACLGMNEDKIPAGKYCISTANRNFEGRQGQGARTLLASPLMAAAAAITGRITDVRTIM